ncbi:elongation factor G [Magnetofaba australis]|uniref:Elongation factor G n=1 Tax=Magnetofaba australis IT-1 TaxID=1434232 RepID=A0A1Y2K095_9PROT|nr:elongation factor G [Magnetofaba australis]OSM01382.1 putative translation elongation factor G [Magnetofaba australis IT-1]
MSDAVATTHIRNVALLAHGGGGATTLAESLFFNGGVISKRGDVARGDTVLRNEPEEIARGITISPQIGHFPWRDYDINIIDTPGYIDFLEHTRGVLSVVGGAVLCYSGVHGVKTENERYWKMVQEAEVPAIGFINKMEKHNADFIRALGQIQQDLGVTTLPLTIPIGNGDDFHGIVDLIPMTAWSAKEGVFEQIELPEEARADAEHYRAELVEKIVEGDDELLEAYLENGQEPTEEQLHAGLKEAVMTRRLLPMFCGSGAMNIGCRALANAIVNYLPSPVDKAALKPLVGVDPENHEREIARQPDVSEPMSAVTFKTVIDPFAGKMNMVRVFSGVLKADSPILNATRGVKEKGGHLYRIEGKEMTQVSHLEAGQIGAIARLSDTHTGDTLCDADNPIHYHRVRYQEPALAYAVEVDSKSEDKVSQGLQKLCEEDPTIRVHRDDETKELILAGMGQTHLAVVLDRLERKYNAKATLKAPKVPYHETLTKACRVQGKLKKQSGGRGQFGDCWIEVEPLARGEGFVFENKIVGGVIPRNFIPAVEKGVIDAMSKGIVGGYPVVDVKVKLVDGSHHSVDSSDNAFRSAGSIAFKNAMDEGGSVLLEPVMAMEVVSPDESMGDVIGDLNSRRGKITGVNPRGGAQVILAEVPMAEVLDYGNTLNALTSGRGLYTMQTGYYQEVPSHIARKALEDKG